MIKNILVIITFLLILNGCIVKSKPREQIYTKWLMYMSVEEMFPGDIKSQSLALAAARGNVQEIDRLVDSGADPNAVGTYGVAVPAWLLYHPNKTGFQRLLEKGADPNKIWHIRYQGTEEQTSLLHETVAKATYLGTDYLRMALEIGKGNPNLIPPNKMYRPIDKAIKVGNEDAFLILYKSGSIIDFKNPWGHPLVFNAAMSCNYEVTLFLLELGVDYNSNNSGNGVKNIKRAVEIDLGSHNLARDKNANQYMWFWRCVDFLEKRGMVFDYTPYKNRPPAVKPAVLDTTPPLSKKPIERMSLTDTALMHEVELTYPVPFWAQTPETKHNVQGSQRQGKGKLSSEFMPLGQTLENWKALMTVTTMYSPGVPFREFIEAVRNHHSGNECMVIEETGDHQICKITSRKGQPVDAIQYLGKFENTFVIVWQAWDPSDPATTTDYEPKALAGARRIVMKKGMNVVPLD